MDFSIPFIDGLPAASLRQIILKLFAFNVENPVSVWSAFATVYAGFVWGPSLLECIAQNWVRE